MMARVSKRLQSTPGRKQSAVGTFQGAARPASMTRMSKRFYSTPGCRQPAVGSSQSAALPSSPWAYLSTVGAANAVPSDRVAPVGVRPVETEVGSADDQFERQAEQVAARVMTTARPTEAVTSELERSSAGQSGSGLTSAERAFFEPRFGIDFSPVRVHVGPRARQSARGMRADAYTLGSNIVSGRGRLGGSSADRGLLAHELVHVAQQSGLLGPAPGLRIQRRMGDGHDLRSRRFSGYAALEDAYDPADPDLRVGARGLEVRIIQQALLDAGQTLPIYGVDGVYGGETRRATAAFQASQGLSGAAVNGIIDATTMDLLDLYFLDPAHDASVAIARAPANAPTPNVAYGRGSAPRELYEGTRTLSPAEIVAVERARTTEVQAPIGGTLPTFQRQIEHPAGSGIMVDYEVRIRDRARMIIDAQHVALGVPAARRMAAPAAVYDWALIHRIADAAKRETDRVFGDYAVGDPMRHGVNLDDAFEAKVADYAAGGTAFEQGRAEWRINKILDGPQMNAINRAHGAVSSRAPEAALLANVRNYFTSNPTYRRKLIEIDHGWPAFADSVTRTVFLQRIEGGSDAENRANLWDIFHTIIHEYIHTLAHPEYSSYARGLPERRGGKTYREGMTEYFAHMVVSSISYTPSLRAVVEDTYNDPLAAFPIPPYRGYSERHNAQAVIGVVGVRNAMAAFFLGEVQFLGG